MPESHTTSLHQQRIGVGLRHPHYAEFLKGGHGVAFLEVHPENYFCGGKNRAILDDIAAHTPLSLHAVGLSLGSSHPIDTTHVTRLKELVERYRPLLVSDHASWSASGNAHLGDLLPLPYHSESLEALCANIERVQQALGQRILIENPSSYIAFSGSTMSEPEFLCAAQARAGCGLILDVNNIYVQAHNHGEDAQAYIAAIPQEAVEEIHLAGHISQALDAHTTVLVDTHSQPVCDDVWTLYEAAVQRFPKAYTLIEWDRDIPPLEVLLAQAQLAATIREAAQETDRRHAACA